MVAACELVSVRAGIVMKLLKPAKKEKAPELTSAQDTRNRLWTLLCDGHTELRRLGMFVWVDDVDGHVLTLQAHRGGAGKKKAVKRAEAGASAPAQTNGHVTP